MASVTDFWQCAQRMPLTLNMDILFLLKLKRNLFSNKLEPTGLLGKTPRGKMEQIYG